MERLLSTQHVPRPTRVCHKEFIWSEEREGGYSTVLCCYRVKRGLFLRLQAGQDLIERRGGEKRPERQKAMPKRREIQELRDSFTAILACV